MSRKSQNLSPSRDLDLDLDLDLDPNPTNQASALRQLLHPKSDSTRALAARNRASRLLTASENVARRVLARPTAQQKNAPQSPFNSMAG